MKRLALIWIAGIALLALEVTAMVWARDYVRSAAATEVVEQAPTAVKDTAAFPLSPFPTPG